MDHYWGFGGADFLGTLHVSSKKMCLWRHSTYHLKAQRDRERERERERRREREEGGGERE